MSCLSYPRLLRYGHEPGLFRCMRHKLHNIKPIFEDIELITGSPVSLSSTTNILQSNQIAEPSSSTTIINNITVSK